jgi:autotransporter-associated beta strand protein
MSRRRLAVRQLENRLTPAVATWDGGGANNLWSTPQNWVGDVAPHPGDDLVFPAGAAQVSNTNDFAAGTLFESIVVGDRYVLGGNTISLANGLSLDTFFGTATIDLGMTLVGSQVFTTSDVFFLNGPLNLNGYGLTLGGAGTIRMAGSISGAGGLIKTSSGGLSLSGNNSYTGITDIRSGTLEVSSNDALGATGSGNDTQLSNSTTVNLFGNGDIAIPEAFRFGQTNLGSSIYVNASNLGSASLTGTLTVLGSGTITGQAGNPLVIAGTLTSSGFNTSLTLQNVVVAATSISPAFAGSLGGTVEFDGSAPNASGYGGDLTGIGTLGMVAVIDTGIVRPGVNGVGTLHASGLTVDRGSGGIIPIQPGHLAINVSAAGAGQVAVAGTVSLGGILNLTVAPGFLPAAGTRYRIIDNDGTDTIVNQFYSFAEGAIVATAGNTALRITYHGGDGNDVELVAGPTIVLGRVAIGAGAGGLPVVHVYDGSGSLVRSFFAYEQTFRGGVNVATADLNYDGVPETITAPGFGGGPVIRIWDGKTGSMLRQFNAYDPAFRGGVNISTGLENLDAIPDIVTGAGRAGGPHVKVFDGGDGQTLASFLAYDPSFTGGVSIAGGFNLIITGAGPGGGPHVRTFNGQGRSFNGGFFAYDTNFTGGIDVAYKNGTILTSPRSGMAPLVRGFSFENIPVFQFMAYSSNFTGGVNLAVLPLGPDGENLIVAGPGPGGGPDVRIWADNGETILHEFLAFDPAFLGGVFVG